MRKLINRLSIGKKIIGLVTVALAIMVIAALNAYVRIASVNREVADLTETLDPVTDSIGTIDADVLEEQLHLERVQRLAAARPPEVDRIKQEAELFRSKAAEVDTKLDNAAAALAAGIPNTQSRQEAIDVVRIENALQALGKQHRKLEQQGGKLLEAVLAGGTQPSEALQDGLESAQDDFDSALDNAREQTDAAEANQGHAVENHESGLMKLAGENLGLTAAAFLAGVVMASLITARLVKPIRRLRDSAKAVEDGDLGVHVIVSNEDEIGMLSQSFNKMVKELRVKEQIKSTFGKYLDPRIVETLIAEDGKGAVEGQRQVMTVFFSDVQGFSALGELLTPSGLVNVMNEYFSLATEPIVRQHGVIDKYIGDAIMAFWGPPFTDAEEHARLACAAALEQFVKLEELRARLPEITGLRKAIPAMNIRIGLCTGEVLVGSVGSNICKSFTVMGDTVNTASRLEGANKEYGTRILISEETQRLAAKWFETRQIDCIKVKGKAEPLKVFELMAYSGALNDARAELKRQFESVLLLYQEQDWERALSGLEQCLRIDPADLPSRVYRDRCQALQQSPPSGDWDGVWQLTRK